MLNTEGLNYMEKKIEETGMLNYHVLESMADWVRVVDRSGTIIYANRAIKKALGESIVGDKCYKAYGRDQVCNFCITERTIDTGEIVQKEEMIYGKYFSIKSSPVIDKEGKIFAAVEVFRDVTRERKLELELIEKNKKMRRDLGVARKIQEKILPEAGNRYNLDIEYIYSPSEMLSGDIFDIFSVDKDHLGIYIADVSGHGVSASMMTMFIRQSMRSIKDEILSPSQALKELQSQFHKLNLEVDKYFTIFYGVFNKSTYEFSYSNAGHNCLPIVYNHSDEKVSLLELKGYPILSLFEEVYYDEKKVSFKKEDKVLFYTDGITEVRNKEGIEFGIEGLINLIEKNKDISLSEIEDNIIHFSWGEQEDDIAIVLLNVS